VRYLYNEKKELTTVIDRLGRSRNFSYKAEPEHYLASMTMTHAGPGGQPVAQSINYNYNADGRLQDMDFGGGNMVRMS
jgi:hypothetical protein